MAARPLNPRSLYPMGTVLICCMLCFSSIIFFNYPLFLFFREKAKNRLAAAYELEKNRDTVLKDIADLVPSSVQDTGTHTISVTHIDSLSKLNSDQVKDTETTFLSALLTKRSRNSCSRNLLTSSEPLLVMSRELSNQSFCRLTLKVMKRKIAVVRASPKKTRNLPNPSSPRSP